MAKEFDDKSRDILRFRPNIGFVEPDQEDQEIDPIEEGPQLEDLLEERKQVRQLAEAVNTLATAVQARVDDKAKEVSIKLDKDVDAQVVQCMRTCYPDDDPYQITYAQYRSCKDKLRQFGIDTAKKTTLDNDALQKARDQASNSNQGIIGRSPQIGGYNTEDSRNGGLRPELQNVNKIIDPVNMEEFQINMICILVNFIWKNFMMPVFNAAGIPQPIGISIGDLLPKKLCDPGIPGPGPPGFLLLGKKQQKHQKEKPVVPKNAPENDKPQEEEPAETET